MKNLNGKTAVITGAAGGMGCEISAMLAEQGVRLGLLDYSREKLDALAEKLGCQTEYVTIEVDVRDEAQVSAAYDEVAAKLGKPDILLNLAGLSIPAKLYEMELADYEMTLDVNLKGTFLSTKHFARVCSENDCQIINIGSMAAKRAKANAPMYCTAKAAVNMLSAGTQLQYKEKGIRVTTLNPGGADTGFWGDRPVKRENLLKASDVAEVMLFVLTRESRVAFSEINFESFLMM